MMSRRSTQTTRPPRGGRDSATTPATAEPAKPDPDDGATGEVEAKPGRWCIIPGVSRVQVRTIGRAKAPSRGDAEDRSDVPANDD